GPIALALCAASTPDDQRLIDSCPAETGADSFVGKFLTAKNLGWAADLIKSFAPPWPSPTVSAVSRSAIKPAAQQDPAPTPAPAPRLTAPPDTKNALPGLPGGPPLPERLSPYRAPKQMRSNR